MNFPGRKAPGAEEHSFPGMLLAHLTNWTGLSSGSCIRAGILSQKRGTKVLSLKKSQGSTVKGGVAIEKITQSRRVLSNSARSEMGYAWSRTVHSDYSSPEKGESFPQTHNIPLLDRCELDPGGPQSELSDSCENVCFEQDSSLGLLWGEMERPDTKSTCHTCMEK